MNAEICGILIGRAQETRVFVEACIPGEKAAQGGAHVTFTQDTWAHIYKVKDKDYPDKAVVGWYHSHPGFGVFLSDHDLFIQENFFSAAHQVAWVYDPHSDEEGCFGWQSGRTKRVSEITVFTCPKDGLDAIRKEPAAPETTPPPGKPEAKAKPRRQSRTKRYAVSALAVVGCAFVVWAVLRPPGALMLLAPDHPLIPILVLLTLSVALLVAARLRAGRRPAHKQSQTILLPKIDQQAQATSPSAPKPQA